MKADTELKRAIGSRIRAARNLRSITQMELADALNVHNITVSKWERGVQTPDGDKIRDLCLLLNVSADFILGLSDNIGGIHA